MSTILTFILYGHFRNHWPLVFSCLLWILINGTWQKRHCLVLLPVELDPIKVSFLGLELHRPAMASPQSMRGARVEAATART
jgi:hypothetical protein